MNKMKEKSEVTKLKPIKGLNEVDLQIQKWQQERDKVQTLKLHFEKISEGMYE